MGIWAKNRWEWVTTHIANMYDTVTTIGFFDAMGVQAVDYIFNQTEMTTVFCSANYVKTILSMKQQGKAVHIKNLVNFDANELSTGDFDLANEVGIQIHDFASIISNDQQEVTLNLPTKDDFPIFSYTSGTTGDSKGVKLTHQNLMSSAYEINTRSDLDNSERYLSYLPMTHSFEQCMMGCVFSMGWKVGFYQGNPAKLTEDAQCLRPTIFASVPRLYNRIFGVIKDRMSQATGCKKWLLNRAISVKEQLVSQNPPVYTSGCYDKLVFNKMRALLGSEVKMMVTGSAPIDATVLNFLKICFCVPLLEGYGLTETSGGSSTTLAEDPKAGHVGGPL